MEPKDIWKECIGEAADECGLALSTEQLDTLANHVAGCHENYGMAFYSPPAGDRMAVIEREHEAKMLRLQQEYDRYRLSAERAVKQALHIYSDESVSIEEGGTVFTHGGRTEQVQ